MFKSISILSMSLSALVITCAVALIYEQPATAQTAGNLKCKGCVSSKDIKKKSIKMNDIRDNAITSAKVRNGSLTAIDLGDEGGVDFDGGDQVLVLDLFADTVVRSVTLTAPSSGFVILNASGQFSLLPDAFVACSLTTDSVLEVNDAESAAAVTNASFQSFGMTEGFVVATGSTTFNLICRELAEGAAVVNSDLTAIYAPTRY